MYQLNYRSTSIPGLAHEELDLILEVATTVNGTKNISGCLVYHNDSFVQILEGKKKDVLEVYAKIKMDARHHTVTLLWANTVENRFFDGWNMVFYRPNDQGHQRFINNLLVLSDLSDRSSGTLLSFWANVKKILLEGSNSPVQSV